MVRSPTWSPLGLLLAFCLVWLKELEALGWLMTLEELEVVGCRVPLGIPSEFG